MDGRRVAAATSLVLLAGFVLAAGWTAAREFPRGLVVVTLLAVALAVAWEAVRRRGPTRTALLVLAAAGVVAAAWVLVAGRMVGEAVVVLGLLVAGLASAARALRVRAALPPAPRPRHAVVVWNPRSGGGKALTNHLADEARARGIEPIELKPGDDLVQLVTDAVAGGADALAAAGGDGTQALVASIAAAHDLPFACIPAGTRNHFALDLGVDRDDVVGALDAFVTGGERRVDLAEVNGRTFVNNVSLGLYAEAVQRQGYRDAKLRTILDTAPDVLGTGGNQAVKLRWTGPDGAARGSAAVVLVSNNTYRLGRAIGSGTRPRVDDGLLGVAAMGGSASHTGGSRLSTWQQWAAPSFEVDADGPVSAGVDGEALVLEPPLRFTIRPGALRVRIAPQHPGASPSAAAPSGFWDGLRRLVVVARGRSLEAEPSSV